MLCVCLKRIDWSQNPMTKKMLAKLFSDHPGQWWSWKPFFSLVSLRSTMQCWTFSFQLRVGSGTRSGWWRRWTWGWSQCSLSWPLYKPNVIVLPEYQNCASRCVHFTEKTQQFHRKSKKLRKKSKEFHNKKFPPKGQGIKIRGVENHQASDPGLDS